MRGDLRAGLALAQFGAKVHQQLVGGFAGFLEDFGLQHAAYAQLYLHKVVPADFFHVLLSLAGHHACALA